MMNRRIAVGGVIAAMVACVIATIWFSWSAWADYHRLVETTKPTSRYSTAYQAKDFPGVSYPKSLTDSIGGDWRGTGVKNAAMIPDSCVVVPDAASMLVQQTFASSAGKLTIQVYGAGQARRQYDQYVNSLSNCYTGMKADGQTTTYPGGMLTTAGDVIVSYTGSNAGLMSRLPGVVRARLSGSGCVALDEQSGDATRSFYYDDRTYTGLIQRETVSIAPTYVDAASPQSLADAGGHLEAVFKDPTIQSVSRPEAPMPGGMKTSLPSAPSQPTLTSAPTKPSSSKVISYQVVDAKGPGCGWSWSGQSTPTFDSKRLAANSRTLRENARNDLRTAVASYNQQTAAWSANTTLAMSFETSWDSYVSDVNAVYAAWKDLNGKRDAFKPTWDAYISKYTTWKQWDGKRTDAANQYASDLQKCEAAKTATATATPSPDPSPSASPTTGDDTSASSPSASPSPSPTATDNDKAKADCAGTVARPAILDQQKPSKPDRPSLPSGMTIPDSWTQDD